MNPTNTHTGGTELKPESSEQAIPRNGRAPRGGFPRLDRHLAQLLQELLRPADIIINGPRPWDLTVHDDRFYRRALAGASLGFGESYMDGWWDCDSLDEMVARALRAGVREKTQPARFAIWYLLTKLANPQRRSRAFQVGERHYDTGNDLFEAMLDKRMTYTCAYWSGTPTPQTLDEAQEAKLDLVCRKLNLRPGQHILDIGCGWGSFMVYAAERYGVAATGVTVSKAQVELGKKKARDLPVKFELKDYREITGQFDHVVSLGMFEHVGVRNHATFMRVAKQALKTDGLLLLQTAGRTNSKTIPDPWSAKYIFPNTICPCVEDIGTSANGLFVIEDWHSIGENYDRTLLAWHRNFENAWASLKDSYSERFRRMWRFYLLAAAGASRSRTGQVWQIVMSKHGLVGGYKSIR